jgi:surface protein
MRGNNYAIGLLGSSNWTPPKAKFNYNKVVVLGNSITIHNINNIYWWGNWGMAASVREKDFVHVMENLAQATNPSCVFTTCDAAPWEADHATYDKSNFDASFDGNEDLVIIRISENVTDGTNFDISFQLLIDYIKVLAPSARIVIGGGFMDNDRDAVISAAAVKNGLTYTELNTLFVTANKIAEGDIVYDENGDPHTTLAITNGHPNDAGMTAIANKIFNVIGSAVIQLATPSEVDITFNAALNESIISDVSAFTLSGKTITNVAISGAVVKLTVSVAYVFGDSITIDYTKPATNPLTGSTGGKVASFTGMAVENKIPSYFTTTWATENAGSATKTIVIPTTGSGYDCYIDWGDGSAEEHQTGTPGNITHVYAATGTKTVKIRGLFPRIYFNDTGDKLKLLTIANWGGIVWSSFERSFFGCANLTGTYTDVPNTTHVTSMFVMFSGCALFNSPVAFNTAQVTNMKYMFELCAVFNQSVASFDTSKVTNMEGMFSGAIVFNQSVANFNTAAVTTMAYMFGSANAFNQIVAGFNTALVTTMVQMFRSCYDFNRDISGFDVRNVTDMTGMCQYSNFGKTNYDALLIAWGALAVQNTVTFHAGTAKYTAAGAAAAARAHLVLATGSGGHGWTITDGGV